MVDSGPLNPDVQEVGVPNELGATRPIARPEANKGLGVALSGAGDVLKDAGELYKETVKVKDFTNKQFTKDIEHAGLDTLRDEYQAEQNTIFKGFTGVDPDKMPGISGDSNLPTLDKAPPAVEGMQKKAAFMAAARSNQNQLDMYYQGRINSYLKQLRQAYPEYRDHIDRVAEQYGFGNSANTLLHATIKANLAIQNQLAQAQGTDDMKSVIKQYIEKGKVPAELGDAAMRGDPQARAQALSIITKESASKAKFDEAVDRIGASEKTTKAAADEMGRATTGRMEEIVANKLAAGTTANGGFWKALQDARSLDGNTDPQITTEVMTRYNREFALMSKEIDMEANEVKSIQRMSPITGQLETVRTSPRALMGENYAKAKAAVLAPYTDIHTQMGMGNYTVANAASNEIQAKSTAFMKAMMLRPNVAAVLEFGKAFKDSPLAVQQVLNTVLDPGNDVIKNLGPELTGLLTNRATEMGMGTPGSGASKTLSDTKSADNSALNQKLLDLVKLGHDPKLTPEMRKNYIEGFFGPAEQGPNSILKKITDPFKRSLLYSQMTDSQMVAEAKKQGGDTWKHYYDYVTNEFGESLFKKEIGDVQNFDLATIPGLKIYYNDVDKAFGIRIGKDTQVLNSNNYRLPASQMGDTGQENYLNGHIIPTVRRLNSGIAGIKNVLSSDKVDATLHQLLQGADKDQVAQGTLGGRMLGAMSTYVKSFIETVKENASKITP